MEHLAIDPGGKESEIWVRSSDGQIVEERRCRTATLPAYLATRPRSRVGVETCSEAFGIADAALGIGHEVRVVPGTLVRSLGVGARPVKTDRRDTQVLSEVSCRIDLPSVHVPSRQARESARRRAGCGKPWWAPGRSWSTPCAAGCKPRADVHAAGSSPRSPLASERSTPRPRCPPTSSDSYRHWNRSTSRLPTRIGNSLRPRKPIRLRDG
jgi:hypothetical protein